LQFVVEVNMKKTMTVDEALDQMRRTAIGAMKVRCMGRVWGLQEEAVGLVASHVHAGSSLLK
jgi:hypothetical protein